MPQEISKQDAIAAVRLLIEYIGDNPDREGLIDTPKRFVDAWEELFAGYKEDPKAILERVFEDTSGYDDVVILRDIGFESMCEHHILPIIGRVHIGYIPSGNVIGISKLARLVDIYAKRLQVQETLTVNIADTLQETLRPLGVGVIVEAEHHCMTTRGVHKKGLTMRTEQFTGLFLENPALRERMSRAVG
ncbi:MAG: GTP cyclohydrolase I FolE [Alphaproteobacteria bacterium]|nr:GTP cyclohydrolase I FolE [Alphaproteobacteria bacterium]